MMNFFHFIIKCFIFNNIKNIISYNLVKAQIDRTSCGQVCPRYFPKFIRPDVWQTYVYNLEANTSINVNEGQSVGIKARVEITTLSPCAFSLQLSQVELTGIPDPNEMQNSLELNPLQFGSFDGKVLGVCPTDNEEIWVLNVKKSVLSALQMSAGSLTEESIVNERDFSGLCPTFYKPVKSDDLTITTIEKSKILTDCDERRKYFGIYESQTTTLLSEYFIQNFPIVKSKSICTQEIQNRIITSVSCTEDQSLEFQENSIVSSNFLIKFLEKTTAHSFERELNVASQSLLMKRDEETTYDASESQLHSLIKVICSQISGESLVSEINDNFLLLINLMSSLSGPSLERIVGRNLDKVKSLCAEEKEKLGSISARSATKITFSAKTFQR
jgi:hypothetical protein